MSFVSSLVGAVGDFLTDVKAAAENAIKVVEGKETTDQMVSADAAEIAKNIMNSSPIVKQDGTELVAALNSAVGWLKPIIPSSPEITLLEDFVVDLNDLINPGASSAAAPAATADAPAGIAGSNF